MDSVLASPQVSAIPADRRVQVMLLAAFAIGVAVGVSLAMKVRPPAFLPPPRVKRPCPCEESAVTHREGPTPEWRPLADGSDIYVHTTDSSAKQAGPDSEPAESDG